jgi:hypothetical protein
VYAYVSIHKCTYSHTSTCKFELTHTCLHKTQIYTGVHASSFLVTELEEKSDKHRHSAGKSKGCSSVGTQGLGTTGGSHRY